MADDPDDGPSFLACLRWHPLPGRTYEVETCLCSTGEEALAELHKLLYAMGYKPPRWWQVWRWRELPVPKA